MVWKGVDNRINQNEGRAVLYLTKEKGEPRRMLLYGFAEPKNSLLKFHAFAPLFLMVFASLSNYIEREAKGMALHIEEEKEYERTSENVLSNAGVNGTTSLGFVLWFLGDFWSEVRSQRSGGFGTSKGLLAGSEGSGSEPF